MLNFINKILKYFWYEVQECETINTWLLDINTKAIIIDDKLKEIFNLKKELDCSNNIITTKDKDILALEHKVENFQWIIEQDKITIEDLNKQTIKLWNDNADLELRISNLDKVCKERYKEVNVLRSRVKWLIDSRDNYKRKYREVCWKIALKKCH